MLLPHGPKSSWYKKSKCVIPRCKSYTYYTAEEKFFLVRVLYVAKRKVVFLAHKQDVHPPLLIDVSRRFTPNMRFEIQIPS